ncbi:MAG: DUF4062 domain-containing protein [Gemmataceae bacterium]|nr:DUF4062 domain-containing protein [Gemmataceae bacterium]
MAKPRVFLSSTFYDLKQIRSDINTFISLMGYDAVLHERGGVTYGKDEKLEEYCYKEIQSVDIVVSVIGNRYGTKSDKSERSISQEELRTAIKLSKQVYIFVESNVHAEYKTYTKNKENHSIINWNSVDNVEIFKFLDDVYELPNNNQTYPFATAEDITKMLREQWAGLLQRSLQQGQQKTAINLTDKMENVIGKLDGLVQSLANKSAVASETAETILAINHPLFSRLQKLLGVGFPLYFRTYTELNSLLTAFGYKPVKNDNNPLYRYWSSPEYSLRIANKIFNDKDKILRIEERSWVDDYLVQELNEIPF